MPVTRSLPRLGTEGLIKGAFTAAWQPVPRGVPARELLASLCASVPWGLQHALALEAHSCPRCAREFLPLQSSANQQQFHGRVRRGLGPRHTASRPAPVALGRWSRPPSRPGNRPRSRPPAPPAVRADGRRVRRGIPWGIRDEGLKGLQIHQPELAGPSAAAGARPLARTVVAAREVTSRREAVGVCPREEGRKPVAVRVELEFSFTVRSR